jgi:hypothetical protein
LFSYAFHFTHVKHLNLVEFALYLVNLHESVRFLGSEPQYD